MPMPDAAIQGRLSAACAASAGHPLIRLAAEQPPPPTAVPGQGWRQVLVSGAGERPHRYDDAIANPKGVVATCQGLAHGGRVVLRPDDHLGHLDDLEAFSLDP